MLNKLVGKLNELAQPQIIEPKHFDDPLAGKVSWAPLCRGGASFRTHKLHKMRAGHLEYRAGAGTLVFCGLFASIGLILLMVGLIRLPASGGVSWMPLIMGLIFAIAGISLGYHLTAPAVFSSDHGYFYKGRKNPQHVFDRSKLGSYCEFDRIHAFQILREHVSTSKGGSFFSYELNLVLTDGSRLNVVDHGNLPVLREEVQELVSLVGKPVWDVA